MTEKTDWAKIIAILFVSGIGLIYLLNKLVPQFAVSAGPFIFIILIGIALWVAFKLFELEKTKALDWSMFLVFLIIVGGIVVTLWKFPSIAPNFSLAIRETMSLIGVP